VKKTARQRQLLRFPVCSPLPATKQLNGGMAASMDNVANVFDEMGTRHPFFLYFFLSIFLEDLYIPVYHISIVTE
jgi:hypothetical protein